MRFTKDLALVVLGLGLVLGGTLGTASASSACQGMVLVTGGGTGGGILCWGDCPEGETCDIKTAPPSWPPGVVKYCDCTNSVPPLCCNIAWVHDPELGHFATEFGSCDVPGQPPCPLPGECQEFQNGSQFTANCD